MTMILIYLLLIPQIYSAHSSKVKVINMSHWTVILRKQNTVTSKRRKLLLVFSSRAISLTQMTWHSSADLTQCYLVWCWQPKNMLEVLPGWT